MRRAARADLKIALWKLFATHLDEDNGTHDASRTTIDGTATRFTPRSISSNTPDEYRTRSREKRLDDCVRLASTRIARRRRQKLDFDKTRRNRLFRHSSRQKTSRTKEKTKPLYGDTPSRNTVLQDVSSAPIRR